MPKILDPAHGWIPCTEEEMAIIQSPLFQRLNWISQLTLTKALFPGGTHTRFIHSLGVMKIVSDYMDAIFNKISHPSIPQSMRPNDQLCKFLKQLARLAALLHDIGHGPFSHAYDRSIYKKMYGVPDKGHDIHRLKMIQHPLLADLIRATGVEPRHIIAIWNKESDECKGSTSAEQDWFSIIRACTSGPVSADRMDFTIHDSHFTGVIDTKTVMSLCNRIIHNCGIHYDGGHLRFHYNIECLRTVIQLLDQRKQMYEEVYLSTVSCATYVLAERMMDCVVDELQLIQRTEDIERFVMLNESVLVGEIMARDTPVVPVTRSRMSANMKEAIICCKKILTGQYPKLIDEVKGQDDDSVEEGSSCSDDGVYVFKTRIIAGVEPDRFKAFNISFWKDNMAITCQEAIDTIKYSIPEQPFCVIRKYR